MRQVPECATAPIGIVGDGRVARHFLQYLRLLDVPVRTWSRRRAGVDPVEALADCRTVLLLIRDDAIVPFVDRWPALREKALVHCSGGLVTPLATGAHPLMTFGHDLYDLATYRDVPFIVDADGRPFSELLPSLPNPIFTIPSADRPYYHALCVIAGTFSTLLWLELFDALPRWGIPASAAHPYLAQATANLRAHGRAALTGPLSRGDTDTLDANLRALEGDPLHGVYAAMVRAYAHRS